MRMLKRNGTPLLFVLLVVSAFAKDMFIRQGDEFDLTIHRVRSIAPEQRIGFGHSIALYAVDATGPTSSFVLYCTQNAPPTGTFRAKDMLVSGRYTDLKLWPVEKKTLTEFPKLAKQRGRMYRVIMIENVLPAPHPDLACDMYSEKNLPR